MKMIRNPWVNAVFVAAISLAYALMLILPAGHVEFAGLLSHPRTLQSPFWNGWSSFVAGGNARYIGYAILVLAAFVVLLASVAKAKYDEYQSGMLLRCFGAAGLVAVLSLPVVLLLVLSDRNYAIESLVFVLVLQWLAFQITNIVCLVRFLLDR